MSVWRRTAIEMLPELKPAIDSAPNSMALWIELYEVLEAAYRRDPPDESLVRRIYEYAGWTWERRHPDLGQAVTCAFYEHLADNEAISRDLPRWMTAARFGELEDVFRGWLPADKFERFRRDFKTRRAAIDLRP